ncbi:GNAT family N-acetyltransferase [Pontibacter sp. H249]|uniref:GNAT family N-acetyltransferase n=1 Tax=Pontibacter sp. H249 TaxID=3133420 RepID=UPI0030BEA624
MNILIRNAAPEELTWVNEQYDKIQFKHSVYEREVIAIAEVEGARAGVGRLVTINKDNLELGGMYVSDGYRGLGLAKQLVLYLLRQTENKTIYCLPFAHLQSFYIARGFAAVASVDQVPEEIIQKWEWCQQAYPQPTLLLRQQV